MSLGRLSDYRGRNKHHNGLTNRLRDVLATAPGPLSIDALWAALGKDKKTSVRSMLAQLVRLGEVVSLKTGPRCHVYLLRAKWKPAPVQKTLSGSGHIAARIEIGRGSVWWAGLV